MSYIPSPIIKHFSREVVREDLGNKITDLAHTIDRHVEDGPEKSVCLRNLLEAQDALRHALHDADDTMPQQPVSA